MLGTSIDSPDVHFSCDSSLKHVQEPQRILACTYVKLAVGGRAFDCLPNASAAANVGTSRQSV